MGGLAGLAIGGAAAKTKIEDFLKANVWKAMEPQLREIAQNPNVLLSLRTSVCQAFDNNYRSTEKNAEHIANVQTENLERLEKVTIEIDRNRTYLQELQKHRGIVCDAISRIEVLTREIKEGIIPGESAKV